MGGVTEMNRSGSSFCTLSDGTDPYYYSTILPLPLLIVPVSIFLRSLEGKDVRCKPYPDKDR